MDIDAITITEPLVDENLNDLGTTMGKRYIDKVQDESKHHEVTVVVKDKDMVPTAIMFSISKRHNVDFIAKLHKFEGYEYVHGFLLSSHFKKVEVI